MNWRRVAFWFGVLALADALLLVVPVGLPDELFTHVVPRAAVPLLALVAAGYGIKVLLGAAGGVPDREPPASRRDEVARTSRAGADIDEAFDALGADGGAGWSRMNAARMLRSELRRSVITALEWRGHPREEAERLIDSGAWTDDRRAAAFLGDEYLPLRMRVRDWASGEGTRRQVEAAAEELAGLTEPSNGGDGTVPERRDRRPAGELLGEGSGTGERSRTERTLDLETEVDA